LMTVLASGPASAGAITIVALGASNTYGKGVARSQSYPAQLEAMLRAGQGPRRSSHQCRRQRRHHRRHVEPA
jgi:lysophospholipase L1-like esterase